MTTTLRSARSPGAKTYKAPLAVAGSTTAAAPVRRRVALVGAGKIADTHAQALKEHGGLELVAIVDPARDRALALARKWGFAGGYASLDDALKAGEIDTVHVLVPPPLHRPVAEQCIAAGLNVLLEKPMAETDADCAALQQAAREAGVAIAVNQNFAFHPAQVKLKALIESGSLGRLRHLSCHFAVPLGQLEARQFGHWMFREPRNLLLEQVVHPLSQIDDLLGSVQDFSVTAAPPRLVDGLAIQTRWLVSMTCERGTAQLTVAIGHSYPSWGITALCDDGTASADFVTDTVVADTPTRWMDFYDNYRRGRSAARQLRRQSRANALAYVRSTLKLKPRSDSFYLSMKGSITAFYEALDRGEPLDGAQGRRLTALCGAIAERAGLGTPAPAPQLPQPSGDYDVLVIGGTGFIGRPVVQALLDRGRRVAVLARNIANLPPLFHDPRVGVVRGDVTSKADLERAMRGVKAVVNLAHAGGADNWPDIEHRIVGGACLVAETCAEQGVERLIHASTIAALYLGDPNSAITGATPPDPNSERRALYARAKAAAERALLRLGEERGLGITILRPGVVIGEGGIAFHSGIGLYNREQHCLGWNGGDNPLPLVLADDTADAVARALERPEAAGRTYNVVGDVRLTAREYTEQLGRALGRPLRYRPQSVAKQQAVELAKWAVKRITGRAEPAPSMADLRSRGMKAPFDTSDIKRDLGWAPEADRATFIAKAFAVHEVP